MKKGRRRPRKRTLLERIRLLGLMRRRPNVMTGLPVKTKLRGEIR